MVRSDPMKRVLPLKGRNSYTQCLEDIGIGSVTIEEHENEDGTRYRQVAGAINPNAYQNIKSVGSNQEFLTSRDN